MKKEFIICALIILVTTLTGCKSEEAEKVDNLILAIGEVTLSSEDQIIEVEEAIDELNEKTYQELEYLDIFLEARNTFNELKKEWDIQTKEKHIQDLEKVIDRIASIEEITLDDAQLIESARIKYYTWIDEVEGCIDNYPILEEAEKILSQLKVQNVIEQIKKIRNISLDNEEEINQVQAAYHELSLEEKEQVTNYSDLEAALEKIEQLKSDKEESEDEEPKFETPASPYKPSTSTGTSNTPTVSDGGARKQQAWVCAQDIVNSSLKAPSTAEYCSYPNADITWNGGSDYTVNGYVDAENGFGAMIRTYFTVTLTLTEMGYKNGYVTFY